VVIDDLDGPGVTFAAFEAVPPLGVDADAPAPSTVSDQLFEAVARRRAQEI
jgi:hypothetical protein